VQAGLGKPDAKAQYAAKMRPNLLSAFDEAAPAAPKEPVDKVDMNDVNDPQANVPYLQDIHRHYREAEVHPGPLTTPHASRPARRCTNACACARAWQGPDQ
jgi:hypothetical protein